MTCGVGGMITTSDPALDRHAREMRFFGRGLAGGGEVAREGNDWLMDEFRACIALAQLRELDDALGRRRRIAAIYDQALSNQPGIRLFDVPDSIEHAYYQYPLLLDARLPVPEVSAALKDKHGVEAKKIYLPVHQETIFREYDTGGLKAAERTLLQSICLPMHAGLTEQDAERAAQALIAEVRARL
jgi:dTDP-4-amino-4,6-dideoxygalactose transaminase